MLYSFFPQYTPDLAHPLFGSILGLLEFFLFLVLSSEVVVFCHNDLGGAMELALEVRDFPFSGFQVRNGFVALPP